MSTTAVLSQKNTAARFDIKLWLLVFGKVELLKIALTEAQIELQLEPDGGRNGTFPHDA